MIDRPAITIAVNRAQVAPVTLEQFLASVEHDVQRGDPRHGFHLGLQHRFRHRFDDEVIAACNEHGIALVFTGRRHFRH